MQHCNPKRRLGEVLKCVRENKFDHSWVGKIPLTRDLISKSTFNAMLVAYKAHSDQEARDLINGVKAAHLEKAAVAFGYIPGAEIVGAIQADAQSALEGHASDQNDVNLLQPA